ncbi:uncharacterized protein METZ01_LOCUS277680, partial [marine metagenome]
MFALSVTIRPRSLTSFSNYSLSNTSP